MSLDFIERFDPDDGPLFLLACQHVDNSMLREISEADYGMDAKVHLIALRRIKAGEVLAPMKWEPREVLELVRWSEPEDPTHKPGGAGARGHWMRLFACTALIRAGAEPANEGYFPGEDSTIIQLVDSAMYLGHEASVAALRFFAWRLKFRTLGDWERPYFAIALLLLSASINNYDPELLNLAIDSVLCIESPINDLFEQSLRSSTWQCITSRMLVTPQAIVPADILRECQEFGRALIGEKGAS